MSELKSIRVDGLGKCYRIGAQRRKAQTGIVALRNSLMAPLAYLKQKMTAATEEETLWALRDVSFDVRPGEIVGIVGRNGAGKSTLLKILSRITDPTAGHAEIRGRINALIEVGTGFHPDLTGRENVYLSAAIHGMRKAVVDAHLDDIVEFSGVAKFLDTPVKRYSSGMTVRLGFAVAAHLNPEVLLVDEVLAVGDADFRKKSLGKMPGVAASGRTVLIVSHNMGAILSLCTRAILLEDGRLVADGVAQEVVSTYLSRGATHSGEAHGNEMLRPGQKLKIRRLRALNVQGNVAGEFQKSRGVCIEVVFDVLEPGRGYVVNLQLFSLEFGCILTTSSWDSDVDSGAQRRWEEGRHVARIMLPTELLRGGEYWVKATSAMPGVSVLDEMDEELRFVLMDSDSPLAKHAEGRRGVILPILAWDIRRDDEGRTTKKGGV
ncbi:MAG: ATP-binding cassette domain-containing protein [Candidatus Pacebacteria bacterium]|nr:ATP-binding cassette domain-containing protein [Candidatus Paceibacterota bacterium]